MYMRMSQSLRLFLNTTYGDVSDAASASSYASPDYAVSVNGNVYVAAMPTASAADDDSVSVTALVVTLFVCASHVRAVTRASRANLVLLIYTYVTRPLCPRVSCGYVWVLLSSHL